MTPAKGIREEYHKTEIYQSCECRCTCESSAASAADLALRFGHVGYPGSLFETSVDAFAECANGKLGDRAEVQKFGASQLGKDRKLLKKLKHGQVNLALPSSVMSSVAPEFGVFEMPDTVRDRDHMRRIQAKLGDVFQDAAMRGG